MKKHTRTIRYKIKPLSTFIRSRSTVVTFTKKNIFSDIKKKIEMNESNQINVTITKRIIVYNKQGNYPNARVFTINPPN